MLLGKQTIKNKKGTVIILYLAAIMCVFVPTLAVLYDIGMYRVAQEEVHNAQEIAGLACIGVSAGYLTGGNSAIGAFDVKQCKNAVESLMNVNLGLAQGKADGLGGKSAQIVGAIQKDRKNVKRLIHPCGSNRSLRAEEMSKDRATQRVEVEAKNQHAIIRMGTDSNATHTFVLKTTGMCYTPFFINKGLLAFGITGKSKSNKLNEIQTEYQITVKPSFFSAVYNK